MKRKSSWSGGWSGGGAGEENEDSNFSFTSTTAPPAVGYAALTRPTILSKEAYIWSEEDDGAESWKLSQYGFKLQETEAAENTIEWRTGDTMRVSMREGYADQVTQFWFEAIGRAATDDYTVAEFSVKNSDVINSAYSRVTWAGYAVHNLAPYFFVQLRRGTASAANAWYATHDGTLKQAWFGATPVAKAGATTDLKDALVAYGLLTDGGATPLNLDGGTLTAGAFSATTLTASTAFIGPIWRPASDSTTALRMQNAAGSTTVLTIDTTNNRVNASSRYDIGGVQMLFTRGTLNYMIGPSGNATMTGDSNMLMGSGAGVALTTGSGNLFIGVNSGLAATEAASVVALGTNAAHALTTGYSILALGQSAGYSTNGNSATYIGTSAGYYNTGNNNVVIGTSAGYGVTSSSTYADTTLVGNLAGNGLTTGGESTMVGFWAGRTTNPSFATTTGLQCTYIGAYAGQASSTQRDRAIAIGYRAFVDASNTIVLGGTGFFRVKGVIGATTAAAVWDVVGGADELQLRIKNYSTQTSNNTEWHNSSSAVMASMSGLGGLVLNESGADADSRFEGDTDVNCFFLDASTDRIGIGTASPGYKLHIAGDLNLSSTYVYRINGTQVLAAQGAAVADASGGATIDAEARTAINTLLARLRTHGLIAT